jgi:hypothetical protein
VLDALIIPPPPSYGAEGLIAIDLPRRRADGEGPLSRFPSNHLAPKVAAARPLDGMVDIRDLKSRGPRGPCWFESSSGHHSLDYKGF